MSEDYEQRVADLQKSYQEQECYCLKLEGDLGLLESLLDAKMAKIQRLTRKLEKTELELVDMRDKMDGGMQEVFQQASHWKQLYRSLHKQSQARNPEQEPTWMVGDHQELPVGDFVSQVHPDDSRFQKVLEDLEQFLNKTRLLLRDERTREKMAFGAGFGVALVGCLVFTKGASKWIA